MLPIGLIVFVAVIDFIMCDTTMPPPNCGGKVPRDEVEGFLQVHNKFRSDISNGIYLSKGKPMPAAKTPIPPLEWDCELEKAAQAWADTCPTGHSKNRNGSGENMHFSMDNNITGTGAGASGSFTNEYRDECFTNVNYTEDVWNLGHSAQMAWAETRKLGCGIALCPAQNKKITVCQYKPSGNYPGAAIYVPKNENWKEGTCATEPPNCRGKVPREEVEGFLQAHNKFRSDISNGIYLSKGKPMPAAKTPIPPLEWDCELEKAAQAWADSCPKGHSPNREGVGENMHWGMGKNITGSGAGATGAFANEYRDKCYTDVNLTAAVWDTGLGHSTQMAWADTRKLGCGIGLCAAENKKITVCQYKPPGNYPGAAIYVPKNENWKEGTCADSAHRSLLFVQIISPLLLIF